MSRYWRYVFATQVWSFQQTAWHLSPTSCPRQTNRSSWLCSNSKCGSSCTHRVSAMRSTHSKTQWVNSRHVTPALHHEPSSPPPCYEEPYPYVDRGSLDYWLKSCKASHVEEEVVWGWVGRIEYCSSCSFFVFSSPLPVFNPLFFKAAKSPIFVLHRSALRGSPSHQFSSRPQSKKHASPWVWTPCYSAIDWLSLFHHFCTEINSLAKD